MDNMSLTTSQNDVVGESVESRSGTDEDHKDSDDKAKVKEITNVVPFHKLFSFADSADGFLMIVGAIAAVGNGLSLPLMTVLFGQLSNAFGDHQKKNSKDVLHAVSEVSLRFVYLALGSGTSSLLQVTCWMITGERQAARIRNLYLSSILRQDVTFFDMETNTGEVVGSMSGDIILIQDAMGEKVGRFIQLVSTFVGAFVIAFIKGWLLTLVLLSSLPPLVIAGAVISLIMSKMSSRGQEGYAKATIIVEQTIGSIRTVASFTGEKQAVSSYRNSLTKAYKSGVHEGLATGLGLGTAMMMAMCSYGLAVWFGAKMILTKGYSGGDVLNVIMAVLNASMSLGQASPCMRAFAEGRAAASKLFKTINRKPEIDAYDTRGKKLDDIVGDIELRDVYFSYPSRPEEKIFSGFSLKIPSGTTAALVGQSGSGKSTVISLIERFYDPQAGEVLIDGIDLKEFQLKWIREKIGLVSQEPVLFASSIKDNIAYGKDGATTEEIIAATKLANAATFIDKLPQGLDTMVGDHGTLLSGGQKQRVAIARAILKNPRILLLDEATSALDAESERVVQEALDQIMINRTTVVVAHRLTTVRNSDMIAVLHQGKLVEKGSHLELLENPEGAYSQLIRLQEVNNEGEDKLETSSECGGELSQRMSHHRYLNQGSFGVGNSSHSSRNVSFHVANGIVSTETTSAKTEESMEKTSEKTQKVPLRRLAYLNKPEIPVLIAGTISAILNGVILPIFAILLSSVIKIFYDPPHELKKEIRFWTILFVLLGLAKLVVHPSQTYFFAVAGCKLIRRIRYLCFERVVNMEIGWFDQPENSIGAIGARLSSDAATVRALVGDTLGQTVHDVAAAVAALAIAFTSCWQLALVVLTLMPLTGFNWYIQLKCMSGFSTKAKTMYEDASQVATGAVGSIRTVASFCAEDKVMELYKMKCDGPLKEGKRQGIVSGIGFGMSRFFIHCVYAGCFYVGAWLVEDGKTKFSNVFRVFLALTMAAVAISQSNSLAADSSRAKSAVASIFAVLDRQSKIDPSEESGMTLANVKGDIELLHISFTYPTRPDVQVLYDFSLTIRSGKTVALIGESGSGKSTVIALLERFYDPDSGYITLDGIDIKKIQLKWLRQQIGLVSQEPVLFNDTIRANIAYGKEGGANEAEILSAAKLANAHEFICGLQKIRKERGVVTTDYKSSQVRDFVANLQSLIIIGSSRNRFLYILRNCTVSYIRKGYNTVVGERGIQLSGGQKQRVAIARAILKSPKILLLDEATSALDSESERLVQNALDRVMVNQTTVVVAHRLSTIRGADVIAVLKNGAIVEEGKHDKLINIQDGLYASLVALHMNSAA